MSTVTLAEARVHLVELLQSLKQGDEIVITENDRAIARVLPARSEKSGGAAAPRKLGFLAGSVIHMADDFDAPLDDMRDYSS